MQNIKLLEFALHQEEGGADKRSGMFHSQTGGGVLP